MNSVAAISCKELFNPSQIDEIGLCEAYVSALDASVDCRTLATQKQQSFCKGRRIAHDKQARCVELPDSDVWLKLGCLGASSLPSVLHAFQNNATLGSKAISLWIGTHCTQQLMTKDEEGSGSRRYVKPGVDQLGKCIESHFNQSGTFSRDEIEDLKRDPDQIRSRFQSWQSQVIEKFPELDENVIKLGILSRSESYLFGIPSGQTLLPCNYNEANRDIQDQVDLLFNILTKIPETETLSSLARDSGIVNITHYTRLKDLLNILKAGQLVPRHTAKGYGDSRFVYLEARNDKTLQEGVMTDRIEQDEHYCHLVFSNRVLDQYPKFVISPEFEYGAYTTVSATSNHFTRMSRVLHDIGLTQYINSNELLFDQPIDLRNLDYIVISKTDLEEVKKDPEKLQVLAPYFRSGKVKEIE